MWNSFPLFGSTLILAVMVVASYTFAVSLSAGATGRMKTLQAARLGAYGTVALIGVAVLCLAYAFVSHDFRLRYVAHYSDRGMPTIYLLTALWGGQDGSLLWWLFLLSGYIGVCVWSLGRKHLDLQPYVIATLMAVVVFFCVLMAFAADPFSTGVAGARNDGEGLNPLLQNYWMIIHPPCLYIGFVGCTVPFAYAIAALVTGRLDADWIKASRKFTLFSLLFLAVGNTLGMRWAYEELGWGGYWAWDPVENAAFMPLLVVAAFIHSVMIQERRGMLKVWNVSLICLAFFMTIFGTFLTRSGSIASVHSFAQSSIGIYFVWFLAIVFVFCASLIMYRWPELRGHEPSHKLRVAALSTGWTVILTVSTAFSILFGSLAASLSSSSRVAAFMVVVGLSVYVAIEIVFRRLTQGLELVAERPHMESVLSREFTFLLNNFGLLAIMGFILVATTFPMVSEALWNEKVTVGPPYYNVWMQPLGLLVFFLMGVGTLFGWKKTSPEALKRAFVFPVSAGLLAAAAHFALGRTLGYPAVVWSEPIYDGALGQALRAFNAYTPVLGVTLCAFNAAVISQEFYFLFRSVTRKGNARSFYAGMPPLLLAFITVISGGLALAFLPPTGRRRYGGYVVHLGIVLMFLGFTGKSWTIDRETTLAPGQTVQVERMTLEYVGPRMEVDNTKRMVFADIRVKENGKDLGKQSPAKFIYKKMPESPTTEVSLMQSLRDDLYMVVGTINPESKVASLQVHLNPLVMWIWLGGVILILGSFVCMFPELEPGESRVWQVTRGAGAIATSVSLGIVIALMPASAGAQTQPTQHSGSVQIENRAEKAVFQQLRCMCGTCPRELLSTCACSTADETREHIRLRLARGELPKQIVDDYVAEYGTQALAIPPNTGGMRAIYAVPIAAIALAGAGLAVLLKRWRKGAPASHDPAVTKRSQGVGERDAYDERIDAELRDLDG